MSGPDLKVDYGLLNGSSRRLQQMKSFFEDIKEWGQSCDGSWGSPAIASAMSNSFAGNWDIHRKRLIDSMGSLSELCDKSVQSFQHEDSKQARSLSGHAK